MPPVLPPLAGAECLEMQGPTEGGSSARRAKRQVEIYLNIASSRWYLIACTCRALQNSQR